MEKTVVGNVKKKIKTKAVVQRAMLPVGEKKKIQLFKIIVVWQAIYSD